MAAVSFSGGSRQPNRPRRRPVPWRHGGRRAPSARRSPPQRRSGGIAMQDFAGRFAVVTGGGTGMGRELARQLIAEGCSVAMCDVSAKNMAQTIAICEADGVPQGARISAHLADVSDEAQLIRYREEAKTQHDTDRLHLLFNNAGIGGGGSMFNDSREEWERTFNVCW